jgi:hypothetical protein
VSRVVEVNGKLYRKPSQEYSNVKEIMFENLCGFIDMPTCICFEDVSDGVENYLLQATNKEFFKVETFYVKPYRDVEKMFIADAISKTTSWLEARPSALARKVESVDRRGLGMTSKAAKEFQES